MPARHRDRPTTSATAARSAERTALQRSRALARKPPPETVIPLSVRFEVPAGCRTRTPCTRSVRPWAGRQRRLSPSSERRERTALQSPDQGIEQGMNFEADRHSGACPRPETTPRLGQEPCKQGLSRACRRRQHQALRTKRSRQRHGLRKAATRTGDRLKKGPEPLQK